jgi:hypothetical protein
MDKNYIIISQAKLFNKDLSLEKIDYIINNNILIYSHEIDINYDFSTNIYLEEINWVYNTDNLRIPYLNNNKLSHIKLDNSHDIYDYISSSTILIKEDIICGEKFVAICDVFIGTTNSFYANPNNISIQKNFVDINSNNLVETINKCNKIFVKTDDILHFYTIIKNKNIDLSNKIIITHNSDYEIDGNFYNILSRVKKQLSQNCLIKHINLQAIPIGIENSQWFDHNLLHKIRTRTDIKKDKNIYFLFSLNTHYSRRECFDKLKNKLEWNKSLSKEDYFIELKKHKYAICPRGNGLDTHRIWECLYLDVIPIMLIKDCINIDNLPIIYLNDWNELDITKLTYNFKNIKLSKVTMNYYKD